MPDVRIIRQQFQEQRSRKAKAFYAARAWLSTLGFRAVKIERHFLSAQAHVVKVLAATLWA